MRTKVTIGVPLYNGEKTLRRCIDSLLAQTFSDIAIHIADDGSRDGSRDVARAIVAEHPQIRLTLQPTNVGPVGNFGFLLKEATTEYFMWVAADDWIAPTYVSRTLAVLETRPDVVACVARVQFERAGASRIGAGGYPLRHSTKENLAIFLSDPTDNARLYGLFRRTVLIDAFPLRHFHAYDWAVTAGTLRFGKHEEIAETLMFRDDTPPKSYIAAISSDNRTRITRMFPLLPMTCDLVGRQRIPLSARIVAALVCLNVDFCLGHAVHRAKRLKRILDGVYQLWRQRIAWRFATGKRDYAPLT